MTTSEAVIWQQRKNHETATAAYLDNHEDLEADLDDEDDHADPDDMPPEVPKRTSSKGVGSVPLASSTSASGRSSAGSMSIRGQVKSVGNGVANTESRQPRICSATGRPLVVRHPGIKTQQHFTVFAQWGFSRFFFHLLHIFDIF